MEEAIAFLLTHRTAKGPWLENTNHLTLAWVPDKWWPLVTGRTRRAQGPGAPRLCRELDVVRIVLNQKMRLQIMTDLQRERAGW